MDAGDPLLEAVRWRACGGLSGCRKPMSECLCLLPCCRASQGVRRRGRGAPQFVSLFPVRALRSRSRLMGQRHFAW
jgi:hypothetical protein